MNASIAATAGRAVGHNGHLVEFYETDAVLVESVARFIGAALREGDAGIVLATPAHRAAFAAQLAAAGIDLDAAIAGDRYVEFDAATMLSELQVGGVLDPVRFHELLGAAVDRASAGHREVRIYGEAVALLLEADDPGAAIALEEMWNDLAREHRFELLCGYPIEAFDGTDRAPFERICELHTALIPGRSFSLLPGVVEQQRIVGELRRETAALRASLERLQREQDHLVELAYEDSLTGLGNRRAFDRELAREWALAQRAADSFVVVADLDGFKALNDHLGHLAGDDVLRRFAGALRSASRGSDVLARIGGDEFAILLVRCDERATHAFRRRLRETMATLMSDCYGLIGVSIGHASLRQSDSPAIALDRADLAMLACKRARRRHRGVG